MYKSFAILAVALALAGCTNATETQLQTACQQDALLQPIVAGTVAATVPASGAAVLIDTTTIHPAVQALCAAEAIKMATPTTVVPATPVTPALVIPAPAPAVVAAPVAAPVTAPAAK